MLVILTIDNTPGGGIIPAEGKASLEGKIQLKVELQIELTVRNELFINLNPDDTGKQYLTKYVNGFMNGVAQDKCRLALSTLIENYFSAFTPGNKIDYNEVSDFIRSNIWPAYELSQMSIKATSDYNSITIPADGNCIPTRSVEVIVPTLRPEDFPIKDVPLKTSYK